MLEIDTVARRDRGRTLWRRVRHWWCRYRDPVRVHRGGVWSFECRCGYRVPIVRRSPEEQARGRRLIGGG
jgi:hypothetical protein